MEDFIIVFYETWFCIFFSIYPFALCDDQETNMQKWFTETGTETGSFWP